MSSRDAWWTTLYDGLLADVLLEGDDDEGIAHTIGFLERALALAPGARVFDQCAGVGRLAIPLAARGYEVEGCDLGEGYAARGVARAGAAGLSVDLHEADAFAYVASKPCAGAFNWWTSFGYAPTDRENARMLARAFESLAPGGRYALDFMNVPGVLHRFEPTVVTRRATPAGEVVLLRESRIDARSMCMEKRWIYLLPSGERIERQSRVRLYGPPELERLLEEVGFSDVTFHGDVDGRPLDLASPRCIAVARRPS
jgi:SAM-dependent methyltransferase